MTNSTDSNYQKRTSWRRLTAFALLFLVMTCAGLYAVYDRFAGRSFQFDDRLLSPTLLLPVAALLLIYFIHHTALFIQADFMLARIAASLSVAIDAVLPKRDEGLAPADADDTEPPAEFDTDAAPVAATRSGYVQLVSCDELREIADAHDVTLRLECHAGHFVVAPLPLA